MLPPSCPLTFSVSPALFQYFLFFFHRSLSFIPPPHLDLSAEKLLPLVLTPVAPSDPSGFFYLPGFRSIGLFFFTGGFNRTRDLESHRTSLFLVRSRKPSTESSSPANHQDYLCSGSPSSSLKCFFSLTTIPPFPPPLLDF